MNKDGYCEAPAEEAPEGRRKREKVATEALYNIAECDFYVPDRKTVHYQIRKDVYHDFGNERRCFGGEVGHGELIAVDLEQVFVHKRWATACLGSHFLVCALISRAMEYCEII